MNEIEMLKQRVKYLEDTINNLVITDRYTLKKKIDVFDGSNITLGYNLGTQLGTASTQKLGFYGKTPIIRPSSSGTTLDMTTVGGTAVTESNGFGGGLGGTYYTIGDIVKHLKNIGLLAP